MTVYKQTANKKLIIEITLALRGIYISNTANAPATSVLMYNPTKGRNIIKVDAYKLITCFGVLWQRRDCREIFCMPSSWMRNRKYIFCSHLSSWACRQNLSKKRARNKEQRKTNSEHYVTPIINNKETNDEMTKNSLALTRNLPLMEILCVAEIWVL